MIFSLEIALGVASGLVLAYILITRGNAIASGIKQLVEVVLSIAGVAVMVWGVYALGSAGFTDNGFVGILVRWVGGMFLAIIGLGIFFFGGLGLSDLFYRVTGIEKRPAKNPNRDDRDIAWGFLNVAILFGVSFTFQALGLTGWMDAIDSYGRAHGMQDGLTVGVFALFLLWPWLIVLALMKLFPDKYGHDQKKVEPAAPKRPLHDERGEITCRKSGT
ncbi:hypothetical protein SCH01S_28_00860 [Sphingomonas changbaiensis NBRC 104936]|uniref:Uncharacterized protein n=1 Tax=Sphingomonas changbaiensis NBRC 104936 TaxID=1219043 RepID=A0A0E9MN62_9SPHN|nr:hypothetical protein [Sphingomonas changbaiensis]GAO39227.1 hypothetical protein SCH01S_28_00860 [Sphingomonas changbaiensis NBRC 104936]